MLEEIDKALHRARERARQHEKLSGLRADVSARIEATRAQIGELERRLQPAGGADPMVDPNTVLAMAHGLRARLTELTAQLQDVDRQLAEVENAPRQYAAELTRKEETLLDSDDPRATVLSELSTRIAASEQWQDRYEAAIRCGSEARHWINQMRGDLDKVQRHSSWDVGGRRMDNILTNMSKQRRLEAVDEAANRAKEELAKFARQLSDMGINADLKLDGIAGTWASDVLFKNFLTDAVKHKQIVMTDAQADDMTRWLGEMTNWLRERSLERRRERAELMAQREEILVGDLDAGLNAGAAGPVLPDLIDHGVCAARARLRRHAQLTRRHSGSAPRLEAVVGRLRALKERLDPLEVRLGRPATVSFTGVLAMLSSRDVNAYRDHIELEALRLATSAHRVRKLQLFDDLQRIQQEIGKLEGVRGEYETACARRDAALRGDPRADDVAQITEALGDVEGDLQGYEEAIKAAEEAAETLGGLRRLLEQPPITPRPEGAGTGPATGGAETGFAVQGLHEADRAAWRGQRALDVLAGHLAGLGIGTDPRRPLPETGAFADNFLNRLIGDLMEHRRIVSALDQVAEAETWALQMTDWLRGRHAELESRRAALHRRVEAL